MPAKQAEVEMIECGCGACGEMIPAFDKAGRPRTYKKGHYVRSKTLRAQQVRSNRGLDPDGLTAKERSFVDAYLTNGFNGGEAIRASDYAATDQPRQLANKVLKRPKVKAAVTNAVAIAAEATIGDRQIRMHKLQRLSDDLESIRDSRVREMRKRQDAGEEIPEHALTGLIIEEITTDSRGRVTRKWSTDKDLIREYRGILEQAAKESNNYDSRIRVEVDVRQDTESAYSKFQDMFGVTVTNNIDALPDGIIEGEYTEVKNDT